MSYKPPFEISPKILKKIQTISQHIGFLSGTKLSYPKTELRRSNQIRTIQASLAIEGNSLSVDQISAILDGKRIVAPRKDMVELDNALKVYDQLESFNPLSIDDFLNAHKMLLYSLAKDNGSWRNRGVGIFQGNEVSHMAPGAKMIPKLMDNLFNFIKSDNDFSWLIKACVFHYELEFIHPFSDGNGRMGRLWQQLLLTKEDTIFGFLPVETLVKNNQKEYYKVLGLCDQQGNSTLFIEFMLEIISKTLEIYTAENVSSVKDRYSRLEFAKEHFKNGDFDRKDYILLHKDISTATASRDLALGTSEQILEKLGEKNQTKYRFNPQ